ncbi:MAG: 50S ribosomal protein L15 [Elusimicrobia bacterium]|nr:50S ribosomal protein L15 [Elusimicrobiota bacterium]
MTSKPPPVVNLSNLRPAKGSRHRRKLLGRGEGSGHGQTATRGMKGQGSRSGDTRMMGFEGGQMPLLRRVPKRGFNNAVFRRSWAVVNLETIEKNFQSGDTVDPVRLRQRGILRPGGAAVKILAQGRLTKNLAVEAHAASRQAQEAIIKAGGTLKILK